VRVTVCQWPNNSARIERAWEALVEHVRDERSELVLLPEMPFYPALVTRAFDPRTWSAALRAHEVWEARLAELGGAAVLATRPVDFGYERVDEGFIWEPDGAGSRAAHAKSVVGEEGGPFERTWYLAATPEFTPAQIGRLHVGFLIGAELQSAEEARRYGEEGVDVLVTPRATSQESAETWLATARAAATLAAACELSSSRVDGEKLGGPGWVIGPAGEVLALTSDSAPFVTVDISTREH
jgi:N-carbamoylputrescine amidase